ncbi:MAG TPA: hypothetical protein VJH90_01205 [archaeon]|nr:hypothetical protein [archaeon]
MAIQRQQLLEHIEDVEIKIMQIKAELLEEVEPYPDEIEAIEEGKRDEREGKLIPFSEIRKQFLEE